MMNRKLRRPLIIGHRGAPHLAPENTMPSFEAAIRLGVDGVEFDVRLSRDGIPILMHDHELIRTTMHPGVVNALTVQELGEIDFRGVEKPAQAATRVPTLQAAIESLQNRTRLFAELKIGPGTNAQQVGQAAANIYLEASPGKSADIMSFAAAAIDAYRDYAPANSVLLLPDDIDTTSTRAREQALADARACGSTTVGLRDDIVTAGFVAYAHRWDIAVLTWPNEDLAAARRGIHAGVDIVVTDSPDALIKRLTPLAPS